jgi:hypothetical protein
MLYVVYLSPNSSDQKKIMGWAGNIRYMGDSSGGGRVMVGRPKVKRPLGRPRIKWEDNIKKDPRKWKWGGMDWIALAQDADR